MHTASQTFPRRWDPVVKLTHWGIVVAVIANAIFTEAGGNAHVWAGYGLAGLLMLRGVWGLIGPGEARFSAFPPSPLRALAHLRAIVAGHKTVHASHNPLGALMVYAIWGVMTVIIASGIAMAGLPTTDHSGKDHAARVEQAQEVGKADEIDEAGERDDHEDAKRLAVLQAASRPASAPSAERGEAGEAGEREDSPVGDVHEAAVNLLYVLIALHLAGVIFETRHSGREIVLAMLPTRR